MLSSVVEDGLQLVEQGVSLDFFKGLRVLVSGGAGFLGSWLCDALVRFGAHVTCLDNLSSGRVDNVGHLFGHERFSFVEADVSSWRSSSRFDVIVHGASIPSPDDYMRRPVETMLPNSVGLLNLLEHARRSDALLLFMSTSEVYGDAEVIPTPESYYGRVSCTGPRSCYDESKRFGEALCMAYYREYGVDVRIARIFNAYGPRMDLEARYARVVPRFIVQALRGEPITVYGDGRQTRSFCYVADTVTALLKMVEVEGCRGEALNIGSPREVAILELAELIKRLTGSRSSIVFTARRPDDPRRRCPDISRARSLLRWEPKISLEEGLQYTIEWFKGVLKIGE